MPMGDYQYESLRTAPLIKDSVYYYGKEGGVKGEPLSVLMHVGNRSGIRPRNSEKNKDKRAYIIVSSNDNPYWKDEYDPDTRLYHYHGDNTKHDQDPDESRGNKVLLRAFDECQEGICCTPIFIFESIPSRKGFKLVGVSKPHLNDDGSPGYERYDMNYDGDTISNYLFKLELVDTGDFDMRPWVESLLDGDQMNAESQPTTWVEMDEKPRGSVPMKTGDDDSFFNFLRNRKFDFDSEMVIDFLLGLKVKPFIILCGGTGTGKTKLAQMYGEYVKANVSIVPVGSNWTEGRYVMGYVNAITGKYSPTIISNLMESSSIDTEAPHILVLDEMNLSHIERYFSDVLSSLESGEPLQFGDVEVKMKDNLFIIGTINMDETTYSISPKVLDRANVLSFTPSVVNDYLNGATRTVTPKGNIGYLQNCLDGTEVREMKAPEIFGRFMDVDPVAAKGIGDSLSEIQKCMTHMGLPLGYRTIDEIMRFLYAAWTFEEKGQFKNWCRYLDSQVLMKILPKVHGDSKIAQGLEELAECCSSLERSEIAVKRMMETLKVRRYTSFIC